MFASICGWGRDVSMRRAFPGVVGLSGRVYSEDGLVGLGEMGGGGEGAEAGLVAMKSYLLGHDPCQLEAMRWKTMNPTASLSNKRIQIHAALEFACLDIMGKATGKRVCDLLGGALREEVPFPSYLFFR